MSAYIRNALVTDPRIIGIGDFALEKKQDTAYISFNVKLKDGNIIPVKANPL